MGVFEGEFVCFLGPSGCGKTTLLRAIAGLDIQTSGSTEQEGRDISDLPPSERDFGIEFQSYALFPNLTVSRNVAYGLENMKMKKGAVVLVSGADELTLLVADGLAKYRGVNVPGYIAKPVTIDSLSEFLESPGGGPAPRATSG